MRLQVVTLPLLLISISCNTTEPPPREPPPKNPREYTWTIDTLDYPGSIQTTMYDIWATSPTDVYAVGHNDRNRGLMWHFDGSDWMDVGLSTTQGGTIEGPIDLSAIYGFAADDIWVVGTRLSTNPNPPPNFLFSSLIIHFNGSAWSELDVSGTRTLTSVWGSSPTDIWMGGWDGALYHYDGTAIRKDSIPISIPPRDDQRIYNLGSIAGSSPSDVHTLLYAPSAQIFTRFFIFGREGTQWGILDSVLGYERTSVFVSSSATLYATGDGVWRRQGTGWEELHSALVMRSRAIDGTDANLFVVGTSGVNGLSGEVYHYNGTDWFHFEQLQLTDVLYQSVWVGDSDVFLVGNTFNFPQVTLILHGQ